MKIWLHTHLKKRPNNPKSQNFKKVDDKFQTPLKKDGDMVWYDLETPKSVLKLPRAKVVPASQRRIFLQVLRLF